MRFTFLFGGTRRENPADVQSRSHELLLRAGFIHQVGAGIFSYLPLGLRSINKIRTILRDEMDSIGGQEINMPVAQPAELWKETGRWYKIGSEMSRFIDRKNRDMVLAMTHEEALGDLCRSFIRSYKQLPALAYQIQTKWRDDPRPRAGLIRVREFLMKDSYSMDTDTAGLEKQYQAHYLAYFKIFNRCDLDVMAVKSDTGMMGGNLAHEFMYLTPIGEDTILYCPKCGYKANRQIAVFKKNDDIATEPLPIEEVKTPDCKTIQNLAKFLSIKPVQTGKMVFLKALIAEDEAEKEILVTAVIRGDMDINESKVTNLVKAKELRSATEEEILAIGAVPGYAAPMGLKNTLLVVDESVINTPNLVCGANKAEHHLKNVNYGRDFTADITGDIAVADGGEMCINCSEPLQAEKAVEVGNIFQLGTFYSEKMGCTFLDHNGKSQPVVMGSYGIGVGRLLSCIIEEHNDNKGICWPITVAPYHVSLIVLFDKNDNTVTEKAEMLYRHFIEAGVETLYDDRSERPGVKFNDADLMGMPIRVTISPRSLSKGGVEVRLRSTGKEFCFSPEEAPQKCAELIRQMEKELEGRYTLPEYCE